MPKLLLKFVYINNVSRANITSISLSAFYSTEKVKGFNQCGRLAHIPDSFHRNFPGFSGFIFRKKLTRTKTQQGTDKAIQHNGCTVFFWRFGLLHVSTEVVSTFFYHLSSLVFTSLRLKGPKEAVCPSPRACARAQAMLTHAAYLVGARRLSFGLDDNSKGLQRYHF